MQVGVKFMGVNKINFDLNSKSFACHYSQILIFENVTGVCGVLLEGASGANSREWLKTSCFSSEGHHFSFHCIEISHSGPISGLPYSYFLFSLLQFQLISVNINTIIEKTYPEPWNYSSIYQFHAQKALFKVPKICNIIFWIEN